MGFSTISNDMAHADRGASRTHAYLSGPQLSLGNSGPARAWVFENAVPPGHPTIPPPSSVSGVRDTGVIFHKYLWSSKDEREPLLELMDSKDCTPPTASPDRTMKPRWVQSQSLPQSKQSSAMGPTDL